MKIKYILVVLVMSMAGGNLCAQSSNATALKIGEQVPDIAFNIINSTKRTVKLSDFRGKLVILDFWAVSCIPCVEKLPYLDSILKANKDIVQIIAVNVDGAARADKVDDFFKRYTRFNGAELGIPVVLSDTKIAGYFPFKIVPHIVWIDKEGILKATTDGKEITESLIKDVYAGKKVNFKLKQDFVTYDKNEALFKNSNGGSERNVKYKSMLTGYLAGIGQSGTLLIDDHTLVDRFYMNHYTFLQLYKKAYNLMMENNRFVLDSRHPEKFSGMISSEYVAEKTFCYELIAPGMDRKRVLRQLRNDLSSYFGLYGKVEKRKVPCLVVARRSLNEIPKPKKTLTEKEKEMTVDDLVYEMNNYFEIPVMNEVEPKNFLVRMKLPATGVSINWNLTQMKEILAKDGLEIREEEREIEVFVLRDVE